MAQEIERKFLVTGNFKHMVTRRSRIMQGYLCSDKVRTVRVRLCDDEGFLTIKSATNERGWSRYEFEQSIPIYDAQELLGLCHPGIIEKVRYWIPFAGHVWEVDVFDGDNAGLIIAEIELLSEDEVFEKPEWVGKEVSGDKRYYNAMLSEHPFSEWGDV